MYFVLDHDEGFFFGSEFGEISRELMDVRQMRRPQASRGYRWVSGVGRIPRYWQLCPLA